MKKLMLVCLLLSAGLLAHGSEKKGLDPEQGLRYGVGLNAGIGGIGLDFGTSFNNHFGARLGLSYFALTDYKYVYNYSGIKIESTTSLSLINSTLILDFHPFKKKTFKLSAGVSYFINNEVTIRGEYNEDLKVNDMVLTKDQVGYLEADITWNKVVPYFAIGFGRSVPKNRWGFAMDLGLFYTGKPSAEIRATEKLEPNADQEEQLEKNISEYQFLPQLNFRLTYRIR